MLAWCPGHQLPRLPLLEVLTAWTLTMFLARQCIWLLHYMGVTCTGCRLWLRSFAGLHLDHMQIQCILYALTCQVYNPNLWPSR